MTSIGCSLNIEGSKCASTSIARIATDATGGCIYPLGLYTTIVELRCKEAKIPTFAGYPFVFVSA
jgi:hypothetical protein